MLDRRAVVNGLRGGDDIDSAHHVEGVVLGEVGGQRLADVSPQDHVAADGGQIVEIDAVEVIDVDGVARAAGRHGDRRDDDAIGG